MVLKLLLKRISNEKIFEISIFGFVFRLRGKIICIIFVSNEIDAAGNVKIFVEDSPFQTIRRNVGKICFVEVEEHLDLGGVHHSTGIRKQPLNQTCATNKRKKIIWVVERSD